MSNVQDIEPETTASLSSDERRIYFKKNGFVPLLNLASDDDVEFIRTVAEAMFRNKTGFERGAQIDMVGKDGSLDGARLPQIFRPSEFCAELRSTAFYNNALIAARELIGPEARCYFDDMIMKPPLHGSATPWHQDEAFRNPAFEYNEISIWLALQAVDLENGCMCFVPGTHIGAVLPHRPVNNDPSVHMLECYDGFDPSDAVPCLLPAGGCTAHAGRTIHGAGPNITDKPRYAYVLIFETPRKWGRMPRKFAWQDTTITARQEREYRWQLQSNPYAWKLRLEYTVRKNFPKTAALLRNFLGRVGCF